MFGIHFSRYRPTGIWRKKHLVGLLLGPVAAVVIFLLLPETYVAADGIAELTLGGRATAAVGVWMAIWWLTEAVHVSVTALLPLALFPIVGAMPIRATAAPYAHELIFLFMGGFILALSMERWGLHWRIALLTLRIVGTGPGRMVGGFMGVTALLSMWVSNTATVIMMLPIAASIIGLVSNDGTDTTTSGSSDGAGLIPLTGRTGVNFKLCLMLGIAYAASIGGLGTVIGTPPNLFVVSFIADTYGRSIGFVEWMIAALPLVLLFLPLTWYLLTKVLFPISITQVDRGHEFIRTEFRRLGRMNGGEMATFAVFLLAALCWILRPVLVEVEVGGLQPFAGLTDAGIAMIAALLLFVLPSGDPERSRVMTWSTASHMPWGVLILFGGGLSLARAVDVNGVDDFIGAQVGGLAGIPEWLVVVLIVALIIFLTELTSNTATTATLIPILAGIAPALGITPYLLIVPAAIAASCAFMMPVATPPNAIVFSSGYVTIPQMARAGIWLNILGIILISVLAYALIVPLLV